MDPGFSADPRFPEHDRNHAAVYKPAEHRGGILIRALLKITKQACFKLLFVKRRLEIDQHAVGIFLPVAHVRACRQHQRTGDAEMREEHLTELGENDLVLLIFHGQRDIFQAQTLHLGTAVVFDLDGYQ